MQNEPIANTVACLHVDMNSSSDINKGVKQKIPESLRKQLSEAGKKRARQMTHEDRVKAARAMWKKRIEKARLSESAKNKEPNGKQSPATPPATG